MYLSVLQMEDAETVATGIRFSKTLTFRAFRLKLFKYGSPDGSLTVNFKDGSDVVATQTLALADLDAAVGTYYHGYVSFELGDAGARVNVKGTDLYKELDIEITLSSHTNSATNYIALAKNFEGAFVDSYGTIISEGSQTPEQLTHFQPYGIEVYKVD